MFKKLRNRLLLVNMLIISALLLGSFGAIYIITYQNIHNSATEELRQVIDFDRHMRETGAYPDAPEKGRRAKPPADMGRPADMMAHFIIYTDKSGNITEIHSPLDIDISEDEISVTSILFSSMSGRKIISYSGGYWAYLMQETYGGYKIAFVDYTSERRILLNLAVILLAVWVAALAAAFIISLSTANKSIKPVEESYNREKQFVADASHELKTPLTTINANIDVLLSNSSVSGEERKWLQYIKSEAERMTKLTNDLLYLARLDHTEEKPSQSRGSISEAAENVILTMEAVAFEKSVGFSYDIEPGIEVTASEEQLRQVMMILLDNAIKYTPEGGEIRMSLAKEKNNAVLRVRNSGEGIGEEVMEHIFDRFYRADKSRARESGGYGLGLAIAKSICEGCGGDIAVESAKGKFTEFKCEFKLM